MKITLKKKSFFYMKNFPYMVGYILRINEYGTHVKMLAQNNTEK